MYIIKNAIKNITRNKSRNIFIAIIIFTIIATSVVAIIINSTTGAIIEDYKSRFGSEVDISMDMEKLFTEQGGAGGTINVDDSQFITTKQYIDFGQSQYIKDYYLTSSMDTSSSSLKALDEDADMGGNMVGGPGGDFKMPTMKLVGNTDLSQLEEFNDGSRKISEGRMYENQNECIVGEEFAKLNNISVGQDIEVDNNSIMDAEPIKLKVVGIYADYTKAYSNEFMKLAFFNRRNEILTSFDTLSKLTGGIGMQTTAKYFLKEPSMLDAFETEIREMGLSKYYNVTTDEASYNKIVGPVIGLSKIAYTFLFIVIILGSIILILLSTLSIRERKYEIGVLRAMGMKKKSVVLGLLTEMIVITAICLCLGLSVGAIVAQPVADTLLEKQVEIAEQVETPVNDGFMVFGPDDMKDDVEPLKDIDVSLDLQAILQIIGISLLLAGVSSIAGISHITKYEPIKILSERS